MIGKMIPEELNWVENRAACSAEKIFRELQQGIENDVASRNSIDTAASRFITQLTSDGCVLVIGQDYGPLMKGRVKILVVAGKIEVHDETTQEHWSASIGMSDEGRCLLRLADGLELEQWQFRKRALEGLFFGV